MNNYDILLSEEKEITVRKQIGNSPAIKVTVDKITVLNIIDDGFNIRVIIKATNKIFPMIIYSGNTYKTLAKLAIHEINNKIIDNI